MMLIQIYFLAGASIFLLAAKVSSLQCYHCKSERLVDGTWTNMDCFMNPKGPIDCPAESVWCTIYTAGKSKNEPYEFGRTCLNEFISPNCYLRTWLPEFLLEERCFPQVCGSDGCNDKLPPGYPQIGE